MNAAVGLMDGLGLDGDRCIRVIPRQLASLQSCCTVDGQHGVNGHLQTCPDSSGTFFFQIEVLVNFTFYTRNDGFYCA